MKKIVSAVLVFVMMLSLAGCGISYDDIKGDCTAKTINGMTIDEYAASLGVDPSQATVNVNITEDDTLTITSTNGSQKFDYERRSNGIELKEEGKDEIYMAMTFKDRPLELGELAFGLLANNLRFVVPNRNESNKSRCGKETGILWRYRKL